MNITGLAKRRRSTSRTSEAIDAGYTIANPVTDHHIIAYREQYGT